MGVQLAGELDPAAEAARLGQWAAGYRAAGGMSGWLAPRREAGERWQVVIRGAAWDEIGPRELADPGRLISHRRAPHPVPHAWISSQRVILAHGRRAIEAWRLDELTEVRILDDLTGVALLAGEPYPDDQFPALLSDIVPWYQKWAGKPPPGYGQRRVDVDWLKFEGVFAAQRDRLDEWARDLPSRLSALVRQAQDAPVQ